jgi:D-alanyl-D-alanine carboxypeptidase/D-alanyl-D-alanine-endopeptidase (penicillin-binding protein 4)
VRRPVAAALLLLSLAPACARQPRPVTPGAAPPPKPGLAALRADLAAAFRAPDFGNAVWGVSIASLQSRETLFTLNPGTFLMPASNMKVVTAAVAAERLGWTSVFKTTLVSSAPVSNGLLAGDLVIVGSGDPSLGGRPGQPAAVLDAWAAQLKAAGVTHVAGRLIGHDGVLDDQGLGQGWAWDYLAAGYATPASGLSFNENLVQLAFTPGANPGEPVAVEGRPAGHGLTIVSAVTTGPKDSETDVEYQRLPGSSAVTVTGRVPAGRTDVVRSISVDNPTQFTAGVVKAGLAERGIRIDGEAVDGDLLPEPLETASARTLATWTSPPLAEILKVLLKVSQNLYADTMLELGGRTTADGASKPGSAAAGRLAVAETLRAWGIEPAAYLQADGSGLSRYNYLTADLLRRVLTRMYEDPKHRGPFMDALPIAGVDGTIAGRMKGTPAENNARAKTGSIAHARSLSGFVTTADGEPLVFSILVNNFNVPQAQADAIIDRVVARLASFRRR